MLLFKAGKKWAQEISPPALLSPGWRNHRTGSRKGDGREKPGICAGKRARIDGLRGPFYAERGQRRKRRTDQCSRGLCRWQDYFQSPRPRPRSLPGPPQQRFLQLLQSPGGAILPRPHRDQRVGFQNRLALLIDKNRDGTGLEQFKACPVLKPNVKPGGFNRRLWPPRIQHCLTHSYLLFACRQLRQTSPVRYRPSWLFPP